MSASTEVKKVYEAINRVQADLAKEGISKDRKNQQQGYNFRGIDDIYNALSPLLAKHHLCILPRILTRECIERTTKNGGILFYTTVEAEFDFVSSEDGSFHTVRTFGEAMDSADKSCNKAQSAAYKYAAMQAFAIPTEGDNDADAVTHELAPAQPAAPPKAPPKTKPSRSEQEEPLEPNYVTLATARMKAHGCASKDDYATLIRFVTKGSVTGDQLKKSQEIAKAFVGAFDLFAKDHPNKKLLDVAKAEDRTEPTAEPESPKTF